MTQITIEQAFQLAVQHHQAGQLAQAETLYRQILIRQPNHADALHQLGVIAHQIGQNDVAVDLIGRAIVLKPVSPEAHFSLGIALQDKGRLDEAITSYRQAISLKPNYVEAHANLGNALRDAGLLKEAIAACRRAISLKPDSAEAHNNLGNALKDQGLLNDAITAFRQAVVLKPNSPQIHSNLGNALISQKQLDEGIAECRQAIMLNRNYPEAHSNLGNALMEKRQLDDAVAAYRQAIGLDFRFPEVHNNLGVALKDLGQLEQAISCYNYAIALNPNYPEAYNNLGNALKDSGQLEAAIAAYRKAIALKPALSVAHINLGNALGEKGQLNEAIAAYRMVINLQANYTEAYVKLGNALKDRGQTDEAIDAYRQAIEVKPDYPEAYNNLGNVLAGRGKLDEAMAAFQKAIALNPDFLDAYSNLGNTLKEHGQIESAITVYRQAIALNHNAPEVHSNLLLYLHYHPGYGAESIAGENRCWSHKYAEPLKKYIQPHTNNPDPDRRIRIGYVSADFYNHASAFFLSPLLRSHDSRQVEVFCYAQVRKLDSVTAQFREHVHAWRDTVGLSDERLADLIRNDAVDILVDLKLHTAQNRLLVFARKPAPVQVTWLGYPGSTGLTTIDYRLSDPYLDPPGMDELVYSEQTVRLPESFWCYDPLDGRDIPVNTLPALNSGVIIFGCLNNFCKASDHILAIWAQVLRQVGNSRLLLLANHGSQRQRALEFLARQGIAQERVDFAEFQPRREYLIQYHGIDIGLDSFPYNGHTTSLDSFWMGIPVVTLVGQTAVSRAGWCQLSNLGLKELAGQTPEQFVQIAVELAKDLPRLSELRSSLRQRMLQSPLMDAPRFAQNFEAAYRQMWQKWCEDRKKYLIHNF